MTKYLPFGLCSKTDVFVLFNLTEYTRSGILNCMSPLFKPIEWLANTLDELKDFPDEVQQAVGYALYRAQCGEKHPRVKPLKGFAGASVLEVVQDFDGDTYRAVYTVRFEEIVYVLHVFQKKSKSGVATAKQDIELIEARLKRARKHHEDYKQRSEEN
jgi:phage-related protein